MPKPRYEDVRRACALCGKEITGPFGTYRFGYANGMICYDCDAKVTEENRRRRQAVNAKRVRRRSESNPEASITKRIKELRRAGKKPSDIAKELHVGAKKVYEVLNK